MKKAFVLISVTVLLTALFTGCTEQEASPSPSETQGQQLPAVAAPELPAPAQSTAATPTIESTSAVEVVAPAAAQVTASAEAVVTATAAPK